MSGIQKKSIITCKKWLIRYGYWRNRINYMWGFVLNIFKSNFKRIIKIIIKLKLKWVRNLQEFRKRLIIRTIKWIIITNSLRWCTIDVIRKMLKSFTKRIRDK